VVEYKGPRKGAVSRSAARQLTSAGFVEAHPCERLEGYYKKGEYIWSRYL